MAQDVFLQIGDTTGGSQDPDYQGWIRVVEYRHQIEVPTTGQAATGRGATSARADHGSFQIVKEIDIASPSLALYACDGRQIEKAKIEFCDSAKQRQKFMEIQFSNVVVVGFETWLDRQGDSDDEVVSYERVSLRYARIDWIYTPLGEGGKASGAVQHYWNVYQNKGG